MEENNVTLSTLQHLLDYDASQFSSAEIQLKTILPEWINNAESLKLKGVLEKYLNLIQEHLTKIEDFFEQEKISSLSINNRIMKAYIEETEEKLSYCSDFEVKDACLLASIQAINHFKISIYGTAAAFAKTLRLEKYAEIFHEIEVNEKQIDDRLSQLAEFEINIRAKEPEHKG
jgi:ferritin-like metal-binding protein YciE